MNAHCRRAMGSLAIIAGLALMQRATWASQAPGAHAVARPELNGGATHDAAADGRAPVRLSDTGLYRPGSLVVDPINRPFSPQYPLWSDGAKKSRWVQLPAGTTIDASRVDEWDFPIGTRFWKEFEFGGRKVETRMLAKDESGRWVFASYVWNDAQTDAELAPDSGVPALVEIAPGKRHSVPSVADCRACHDSARTEVLGFNMLQLSEDRDPNAPHAEPLSLDMLTLKRLVAEGRITGVGDEAATRPPRIRAATPTARAALGYLSANCGGCHNTASSLATLGLVLKHSHASRACAEPGLTTSIDHPTTWLLPNTEPGQTLAIRPGVPAESALVARMRSRRAASQMPPLGTVLVDREAVDLVSRWIAEDLSRLPSTGDPCAPAMKRSE
jgi:hypothetical protein